MFWFLSPERGARTGPWRRDVVVGWTMPHPLQRSCLDDRFVGWNAVPDPVTAISEYNVTGDRGTGRDEREPRRYGLRPVTMLQCPNDGFTSMSTNPASPSIAEYSFAEYCCPSVQSTMTRLNAAAANGPVLSSL